MKILDGKELAGFIKERQLHVVRSLKQSNHIQPKLVILRSGQSPVTDVYLRLKKSYGEDIGVFVDVKEIHDDNGRQVIDALNHDESVHGVVIQLPLLDIGHIDELLDVVTPEKDVDGLGRKAHYDPATPIAINWLLAGYNIDLVGKNITIVGQGRLVGAPLAKMWEASGLLVTKIDINTPQKEAKIKDADVIVSATGQPGSIVSNMVKTGAVVVDAGTATDANGIVGDVAEDVRLREDITITPVKGGVGPLTIAALFENLLNAARRSIE